MPGNEFKLALFDAILTRLGDKRSSSKLSQTESEVLDDAILNC